MNDKFEQLIKNLPEEPMKINGAERTVNKIVRHFLINFWKKRVSIVAGIGSIIFGVLMIQDIIDVAGLLDTAGFWWMLSEERGSIFSDFWSLCLLFLGAHPCKEIGILLALIALFSTSLYVLLKKEEW